MRIREIIVAMGAVWGVTVGLAGDSEAFLLDTTEGLRIAHHTETIVWSGLWAADDSAVVTVTVNDAPLFVDYGEGVYEWTPSQPGIYVFRHSTAGSAETLEATFRVDMVVTFDANGGYGDMTGQTALEGDNLTLAANGFLRTGYVFVGWAESADGDVAFSDGATSENVVATTDATILYAVWKPYSPSISPAGGAAFSNTSQAVSLSCNTGDAIVLYTTDGSDPVANGREYRGAFEVYESCTVRAVAYGSGRYSDEAVATFMRSEPLSAAANLYGYLMETDAERPWTVVTDVSHDGVLCVRSGAIGNGGTTWLQTSVKKAGRISFWWRAACEEADEEDGEDGYYDYGAFLVDDAVVARIAGHDTGWRKVEQDVPAGGKHVLRWEYRKDGSTTYSPDCVWLDQVQWVPAAGDGHTFTAPEQVPYSWLAGYGLGVASGDFEAAAKAPSGKRAPDGKAMSVWEDFVAGTDPTNANSVFTATIEMVDGAPRVRWSPDLNSNGVVRTYTVFGKAELSDESWHSPTNAADRFFKVEVGMP